MTEKRIPPEGEVGKIEYEALFHEHNAKALKSAQKILSDQGQNWRKGWRTAKGLQLDIKCRETEDGGELVLPYYHVFELARDIFDKGIEVPEKPRYEDKLTGRMVRTSANVPEVIAEYARKLYMSTAEGDEVLPSGLTREEVYNQGIDDAVKEVLELFSDYPDR